MKVGIVGQRGNPRAASLAGDLREELRAADVEVMLDAETAAELAAGEGVPVSAMDGADLVVSIGGDGTFLFAARGAGTTPVMGVNLGEVGFLNAVSPEDALEAVREEVERIRETGAASVREMPRVRATGADWTLEPAINEVAVMGPRRGHGQGLDFELRVDGSLYTGGHADGVLVSTPTGSTAYNLSEGGPLVHPTVAGLVVTEMCGAEPMPSLVVDTDAEVEVLVDGADRATVVSDGRLRQDVSPPARVVVGRADEPVRIAGPSLDFFAALGKLD